MPAALLSPPGAQRFEMSAFGCGSVNGGAPAVVQEAGDRRAGSRPAVDEAHPGARWRPVVFQGTAVGQRRQCPSRRCRPGRVNEDTARLDPRWAPHGEDGPELPRGELVGRHVVLRRLGAGGMGVVYAAYDPELDRKVALKLLLAQRGGSADEQARLLREAKATAQLAHPNVVAVHDVGTVDGRVWMAMEFVAGETRRGWLAAARRSWREVLARFLAAGEGLRAAHAAGLVHRDFNPGQRDGRTRRARPRDGLRARPRRGPATTIRRSTTCATPAGTRRPEPRRGDRRDPALSTRRGVIRGARGVTGWWAAGSGRARRGRCISRG